MNIFNVRKGQFVYYNNRLHRVYGVKPFFKKSVHLIRLSDFTQQLSTAKEIDLYKPKHLDRFTFNKVVYTLDKYKQAEVGDYILVTHPSPDYLDNYDLHAIEMVAEIETNGIISSRSNGIKHREYWVMVPEILDGATNIDLQNQDLTSEPEHELVPQEPMLSEAYTPRIGDVFMQVLSNPPMLTMVVAIQENTIYLAGGFEVTKEQLANPKEWMYSHHVSEQ